MSVKLFVTDLDGTLLPAGQNVSRKNIEAVHDMVKAGITFTIATGRMYKAAVSIAKNLEVDVPIITYNGALIKSVSGEIFHTEYLSPEIIIELTNFFEQHNWFLQSYSNDSLYYPVHNELAKGYEQALKVSGTEVGWNGLRELTENVPKMLSITSGDDETAEVIKAIKAEFGDKIEAIYSNANYVEIINPGVSKAAALSILADKLHIDKSETMAIGDSNNDLPMLKAAGTSIAMGNAVDEIKNICDFVTGNCEDDGFAEAVYKYVLT